ncbi:MAG: type IV secretory system conjugative DNA transfer family protein [Chloroflexota bacterium]
MLGGIYAPIWLLQHVVELLGPLGGLLVSGLILVGAWKRLFLWLDLPTMEIRQDAKRHARAQGRLSDAEILKKFALGAPTKIGAIEVAAGVIPLGHLSDKPIGIPWTADAGHMAVVGPTRSGKGLHLTDTLIRWPGPVVCNDPKGEQWQRTAGFRQQAYGPVFRIPPQGLDLADLYDLNQDLDVRELHETLLRPWQDGNDRIFADKALPLLTVAVKYGNATGEHPLAVLGRVVAGFTGQRPPASPRHRTRTRPGLHGRSGPGAHQPEPLRPQQLGQFQHTLFVGFGTSSRTADRKSSPGYR